ncbi:MAG: hypothetical protein DA330_02395 [Nitrososphaera sp.]|nr:hypothetical protein [Nitrososphaera sp.]
MILSIFLFMIIAYARTMVATRSTTGIISMMKTYCSSGFSNKFEVRICTIWYKLLKVDISDRKISGNYSELYQCNALHSRLTLNFVDVSIMHPW